MHRAYCVGSELRLLLLLQRIDREKAVLWRGREKGQFPYVVRNPKKPTDVQVSNADANIADLKRVLLMPASVHGEN